ncbi:formimidoylglutamate deiminase [Rhodospirillum rubrum]|uniref:formimidoylglutamate deiminase n=1 Tax=Rhodospirillum rubrum TaxID=1085 RepID=UPI00190662E6|nr:formimidoylglutamate deiminase [Rhodospirillum rubrum]MBK1663009.1 formimidoylglutamate deiminase [Rhodospirillum rubrum]MBK1676022.1 formimidoylglutamate deiminase [Rhodospirillum rubrum]
MRNLFFQSLLLPEGWAENVAMTVDENGMIATLSPGSPPPASGPSFRGPAFAGIPNLHSHAHQRALAGSGERSGGDGEDSFWSWRKAMYAALARLTPEAFEDVATQLYVEMVKAGYTAVAEFHYLHHDHDGRPFADPAEMSHRLVAAARTAGIALTLLPVLYSASGFDGAPPTQGQKRFHTTGSSFGALVERLKRDYGRDSAIVLGIAPHSLRAVPAPLLAEVIGAHPEGPIHLHIAEQTIEVSECLAHTGQRPVEWLLDHVDLDPRWCLIHATHVTDQELAGIAASRAVVGLCPTTEANLGDGLFPADRFLGLEGRFGIGSDSHISVNPVEELRWLEYGQRLTTRRRSVLAGGIDRSTGRALIEQAQISGAKACAIKAGRLAVGQRADIVVLDGEAPVLCGRSGDGALDAWIFSGNAPTVHSVVVGGALVVENGRHRAEEAVARRFASTLGRLLA